MSFDSQSISGNASDTAKLAAWNALRIFRKQDGSGFAENIIERIEISNITTEANHQCDPMQDKDSRTLVVAGIVVEEYMTNREGCLHVGCVACIIGACALLPLVVHDWYFGTAHARGVTQGVNIMLHDLPRTGSRLRITSETLHGSTSLCKIWDETENRLFAFATHAKGGAREKISERTRL